MSPILPPRLLAGAVGLAAASGALLAPAGASAATTPPSSLHSYSDRTVGSVAAPNGDVNPYGVAVVPLSMGKLVAGDVLVTDFNNHAGTAGGGTTILQVDPTTGASSVFASGLPISGPVGIAINPVNDGVWVGDFGASDGTTSNDLLILPTGMVKAVFDPATTQHSSSQQPTFDGVWGQGVSQSTGQVSFYYGTTGSGATGAGGGEVWRIDPHPTGTANGQPTNATYVNIARGLGDNQTAGKLPVSAANATGPEGFAYDAASGTLYVSDDANDTVYALAGAATATGPVTPRVVLHGGVLNHPENIALDPATGDLLVANAGDNTLVEIDPHTGFALGSRLLDGGAPGALFGMTSVRASDGSTSVFYVDDNTNTLHELIAPGASMVVTGAASQVTATTARLHGVINTGGAATSWQFEYGLTERYGRGTPLQTIPAGRGQVAVSVEISHLAPGTVIHYRLVATSHGQATSLVDGADRALRTRTTGRLLLRSRVLTVRGRDVLVGLRCDSALACRGKLSITTRVRIRHTRRFGTLVCATTRRFFDVRAHGSVTISVPVRPACLALVGRSRGHRLVAKLTSAPRTGQKAVIAPVVLVER